jgi:protein SCO1/2
MKLNAADWLKIIGVLVVFTVGLIIGYQILKPKKVLPVYNPADLDRRLVAAPLQNKGSNHRILDFSLYNQFGDTITMEDVKGKILVADFFFTTCPGICKDMAVQKRRLQEVMMDEELFMQLSHSVTPVEDSVPVMFEYGKQQGAIRGRWHLLTGPKPEIYRLARESYFAIFDEGGAGDEADFIHTENFVLVDPQKRIRGFYDGTSEQDVDRLIEDYQVLKKEVEQSQLQNSALIL